MEQQQPETKSERREDAARRDDDDWWDDDISCIPSFRRRVRQLPRAQHRDVTRGEFEALQKEVRRLRRMLRETRGADDVV